MAGNDLIPAVESDGAIDRKGSKIDISITAKILTKLVVCFQLESVAKLEHLSIYNDFKVRRL